MKRFTMIMLAAVVCCGLMAVSVRAEDDGEGKVKKEKKEKAPKPAVEKKEKPAKPELAEVSVTGVISKNEEKKGEKSVVKYVLTDGQGNKITLPTPKKDINLDEYIDVSVTVTGKGMKATKKDKEVVTIKEIVSIEKGAGVGDVEVFPKDKGDDEVDGGGNEGAGDFEE